GAGGAQAKPSGQGQAAGGQGQAAAGQGQSGGQGRGGSFEQPGGQGVLYLLKDGKSNVARVQFGPSDGRFVQVTSGVNEGDTIITGGGPTVTTGNAQAKPGGGAFGGFGPKPGG
ncbi:MAG: hypothetical protein ACHQ7M_09030, partial [Chloroflexota bacterium]